MPTVESAKEGAAVKITFGAVGSLAVWGLLHAAPAPETPHLEFVREYLREVGAIERIRAAAAPATTDSADEQMSNCINLATSMQLELGSQAHMMKQIRLNAPYDFLPASFADIYEYKIQSWSAISDVCSTFIGGQRPGVDYQKQLAELPKIRARIDYLDQTMFQAANGVFASLIDDKPDKRNHVSHMIITKAERDELLQNIQETFGTSLEKKDKNWLVSSVWVIRAQLHKFKCTDDPWD